MPHLGANNTQGRCCRSHFDSWSHWRNFISKQAFTDVVMECHAVVLHIRASRDTAPKHPVCLGLTGSDCCETAFSATGSMKQGGNTRTYSALEFARSAGKIARIEEVKSSGSGLVFRPAKKRACIWNEGVVIPEASLANLSDYGSVGDVEL